MNIKSLAKKIEYFANCYRRGDAKISDKEFMGCVIYDSKEHLEAANEAVQEFMKINLMPYIDSPPVFMEGEVPWRYSRK